MRLSSYDIILIEEACIDINNDYFRKLDIGALCKKYRLSEIKLIKGFVEMYGIDIRVHYREQCMRYAKRAIKAGATFVDLSILFEYSSVYKFTHDYKKYLEETKRW
jgi:AraC-like DNA-binding protein